MQRLPSTTLALQLPADAVDEVETTDGITNIIDTYAYNEIWALDDKDVQLDQQLLHDIGKLTGTTVHQIQGTAHSQFVIKSDEAKFISKAIMKLEVISRHVKLNSSTPHITNLQYCEGATDLTLQIVPLKQLEDRRLATTLVDPSTALARNLVKFMCVIVREQDEEGKRLPLKQPVPNGRSTANRSLIWLDHKYKAFQHDPGQTWSEPKSTASPKKSKPAEVIKVGFQAVDEWSQMCVEALADPFKPLPEEREKFHSTTTIEQATPTVMPPEEPERKRRAKKRKPQSANEIESWGTKAANGYCPGATTIEPQPILSSTPKARSHDTLVSMFDATLPEIAEPYMPPDPQTIAPKNLSEGLIYAALSKSEHLVDYHDNELAQNLKPVAKPHVKKDDLRQTMRQKKGPTADLASGILLLRTKSALKDAIDLCRSTVGQLGLSVKIGRLLINPKTGSSEFKDRPFTPDQWHHVFPNSSATSRECEFTPRLTAYAPDADFLQQLKYTSGRRLFQEAKLRSITYRFDIHISHDTSVTLELDENGETRILSASSLIGAINWHYPRRYWDSRLEVEVCSGLPSPQQAIIRDLVNKISLIPSSEGRMVKVLVKDPHLNITGISLLQKTMHRSETYPSIELHLTNVEQLDVVVNDSSYTAQPQAMREAIRRGKSWWEAKLQSVSLNDLFQENRTLERGEMTVWAEHDVLNSDALRHLEFCSRDIVTRIDTVGYFNHGPRSSSGTNKSSELRLVRAQQYW